MCAETIAQGMGKLHVVHVTYHGISSQCIGWIIQTAVSQN